MNNNRPYLTCSPQRTGLEINHTGRTITHSHTHRCDKKHRLTQSKHTFPCIKAEGGGNMQPLPTQKPSRSRFLLSLSFTKDSSPKNKRSGKFSSPLPVGRCESLGSTGCWCLSPGSGCPCVVRCRTLCSSLCGSLSRNMC